MLRCTGRTTHGYEMEDFGTSWGARDSCFTDSPEWQRVQCHSTSSHDFSGAGWGGEGEAQQMGGETRRGQLSDPSQEEVGVQHDQGKAAPFSQPGSCSSALGSLVLGTNGNQEDL